MQDQADSSAKFGESGGQGSGRFGEAYVIPRRRFSFPGVAAVVISGASFFFSAVTFYQTVLKQAQLAPYIGEAIRYGKTPGESNDAFVIPLTITNRGARDSVVTGLELWVTNGAQPPRKFVAAFFGDSPDRVETSFAPLPIGGRGHYSGSVVFEPADRDPRAPRKNITLSEKEDIWFCLVINGGQADDFGMIDRLFQHGTEIAIFNARSKWFAGSERVATLNVISSFRTGGENRAQVARSCERK
jgi:hypothetical protein